MTVSIETVLKDVAIGWGFPVFLILVEAGLLDRNFPTRLGRPLAYELSVTMY
ncbi:MAG: hypothetical protein Q8O43_01755 [Dehalococcoidia bacterium]|nr:hypothetical protein [Dehalococcoidia bacterium]